MDKRQIRKLLEKNQNFEEIIQEHGYEQIVSVYGFDKFLKRKGCAHIIKNYGIESFILTLKKVKKINYYRRNENSEPLRSANLFLIINEKISPIDMKMFLRQNTIRDVQHAYMFMDKDITFLALKKDGQVRISPKSIYRLDYVDNNKKRHKSQIYTLYDNISTNIIGSLLDEGIGEMLDIKNYDAEPSKATQCDNDDNITKQPDSDKSQKFPDIPPELEAKIMSRISKMEKDLYEYANRHGDEIEEKLYEMKKNLRQDMLEICRGHIEEHTQRINRRFKEIYKYQCEQARELLSVKESLLQQMYNNIMKRLDEMDNTQTVKDILGHLKNENNRNKSVGQTIINLFSFIGNKIPDKDTLFAQISNKFYFREAAVTIQNMIISLTSRDEDKSEATKFTPTSEPLTLPPALPPISMCKHKRIREESETISLTEYEQWEQDIDSFEEYQQDNKCYEDEAEWDDTQTLKELVDTMPKRNRNNMYESHVYVYRDDIHSENQEITAKSPFGIFLIIANKKINYRGNVRMTPTCKEIYKTLVLSDRKHIFKYVYPDMWKDINNRYKDYVNKQPQLAYNALIMRNPPLSTQLIFDNFFEFYEYKMKLTDYKHIFSNRAEYYIEEDTIELESYKRSDKRIRYQIWFRTYNNHDMFKDSRAFDRFEYYESLFGLVHIDIPWHIKEKLYCNSCHVEDYKKVGYFQHVMNWFK